jgi:hypothetical protein
VKLSASILSTLFSGKVDSGPDVLHGKRGRSVGYVVKDRRLAIEQSWCTTLCLVCGEGWGLTLAWGDTWEQIRQD